MSASKASGQQITSKMHQSKNPATEHLSTEYTEPKLKSSADRVVLQLQAASHGNRHFGIEQHMRIFQL
jgi:hypothetical protein